MSKRPLVLLIVLVEISFFDVFSQTMDFQRINTLSGLSNNTVISILQDRKGFIWIGTDDGLNRYDGNEFKIFKPEPKNPNSLAHNIAKALFEDSKGNIWIGTDGGGLTLYEPNIEIFTNFLHDPKKAGSLSNDNVTSIVEDKKGIIWIGTYGGGLNKFDSVSKTFMHFRNEPTSSNSVCSDYINCLFVDTAGNLWIGTWAKGLDRYNIRENRFKNFQNTYSNKTTIGSNTINSICQDTKNRMWIGTWQGDLNLYNPYNETFIRYCLPRNIKGSNNKPIIRSICQDNAGDLWLGTFGDGLYRFNPSKIVFSLFENMPNNIFSLSNNNIWDIYCSRDNILWIGNIEGGLNKLDLNPKKFTQYSLLGKLSGSQQSSVVSAILETQKGDIVVGTWGAGVYVLNTNLEISRYYRHSAENPNSLGCNSVNNIIEDRYDNLWIGGQDALSVLNSSGKFRTYTMQPNNLKTLSISNINNVFEDHFGTIWVATWGGGLNRYDSQTDQFHYYLAAKKSKVTFYVDMSGYKISLKGVHVAGNMNGWNTQEDKLKLVKDNIYGITLELYPGRVEYKFLNGDQWGTEEIIPKECAENNNRYIYVGSQDVQLDAVLFARGCNKIATQQMALDSNPDDFVLSSNHVYCVTEDRSGTLWVGTNNGLNKYIRESDTFVKYLKELNDTNCISDNHVSYIYEDVSGNLWIGTLGGGLNRFNPKSNSFISFSEKDGLANNMVKGILEDNHGNLWVSTNNGISKFNLKTHEFTNFDISNGLQENIFRVGACLKRSNGEMLFGNAEGVTIFHPDSLANTGPAANVIITDLLILNKTVHVGLLPDGRKILTKSIQNTEEIRLSYKDNFVSFKFTTLQYSSTEKNRFAYKLEGFDKEWHYTDNKNRLATYTNLSGGEYTFMVKTLNSRGFWNDKPTKLIIIVTPPFWKTYLFFVLLIIVLIFAIYLWYRLRILSREKKLIREKLIAERKIIQLEKEKLQVEVDHKNNELATLTMHMVNKAKLLTEQINHLELLAKQTDKGTQEKLNKLLLKLHDDTSMDNDWEYFELHFDKVYQNFISKLKNQFSDLSASDIRLAAYIRMGLSTKEIAELMNKTVRGIESGRYRLRQNLNLDTGDNLTDFLFKL